MAIRVYIFVLLQVLALLAALHVSATAVSATTFVVNSELDEPDASEGDGNCVSTPSAKCTIRAALMEANAKVGDDVVNVPAGAYILTVGTDGLSISSNVTVVGAGALTTVIDVNGRIGRAFLVS